MKTFIDICVDKIIKEHPKTDEFILVIPSKRARKYFFEAFVRRLNKPLFLPDIITIDELIQKSTKRPIIDKTRQLFILYQVATQKKEFDALTFEAFLTWGNSVLNDFDELQRYLIAPEKVFKNLISIKELESWNLGDDKKLSESQQQFMLFWESLPSLYVAFNRELAKRNLTTSSIILEQLAVQLKEWTTEKYHYFIGFNALTRAEQKVIQGFLAAKQGAFWIDADQYYLENEAHEAGMFHRTNLESFTIRKPQFISDGLCHNELSIDLVECPQITGQIKVAASELCKLTQEELNTTIVLLADESLILPMLKNIPNSVAQANLSLGLPLAQTPLKSFVDILFSIQENKERFKTESAYYKDILALFQHPYITVWIEKDVRNKLIVWELETVRFNRVFQNPARWNFDPMLDQILDLLFMNWKKNYDKALGIVHKIIDLLLERVDSSHQMEQQILYVFQQSMIQLSNLVEEGLPEMNLRTFKSYFNQHWMHSTLAYHGNPTNGLQIMGLLETRLLDFEQLIIIGLNEGVLPNHSGIESNIPMDLRRALGLPTNREKQGLYAHHFYRLFHRAKKALITYSVGGDGMRANEASRYIAQIEMELLKINPRIQITKRSYSIPMHLNSSTQSSVIQKRTQVFTLLDNYFSRNISASAFNKYLNCSMDFYYRYIAELGEGESMEENVESSSMGQIIHSTLEILYTPFAERDKSNQKVVPAPRAVTVSNLEELLANAPEVLKQQFIHFLDNDETLVSSGKNYLTFTVALQLINNLIQNDIAFLNQSKNKSFYIHRLEAALSHEMKVEIHGKPLTLNWIGFIDRIDRIGDEFRIIDYKSGKVTEKDTKYEIKEDVKSAFTSCKHALQLAVYLYLFEKNYGFFPSETGIYAIQKNKNAWFPLDLNGLSASNFLKDFQLLVEETITELYDLNVPFAHNTFSKYCPHC